MLKLVNMTNVFVLKSDGESSWTETMNLREDLLTFKHKGKKRFPVAAFDTNEMMVVTKDDRSGNQKEGRRGNSSCDHMGSSPKVGFFKLL